MLNQLPYFIIFTMSVHPQMMTSQFILLICQQLLDHVFSVDGFTVPLVHLLYDNDPITLHDDPIPTYIVELTPSVSHSSPIPAKYV